ncbi:hypothetical protein EDD18DRAFT_1170800 [Armillaria luteobubalina]|uniref:Uncharacterized protein n=1 Tax=Armillaria luteobubalina TaxID=153913 RepID=A0AA39UVX0_9AGAR|nr:hypothetical protein EDD18DRAFT_1170800 [Armillaria luteobubalina]
MVFLPVKQWIPAARTLLRRPVAVRTVPAGLLVVMGAQTPLGLVSTPLADLVEGKGEGTVDMEDAATAVVAEEETRVKWEWVVVDPVDHRRLLRIPRLQAQVQPTRRILQVRQALRHRLQILLTPAVMVRTTVRTVVWTMVQTIVQATMVQAMVQTMV